MMFDFRILRAPTLRTDRHRLAGKVTVDGVPARRHIIVFDRLTFVMVAATVSDPATGEWEVTGLPQYPERQLLVLSPDSTGNYNAEVADYISQVVAYVPPVVPSRPWTPADITTELWLDAADAPTIISDVNGISQWSDKSGKSRHAVQGTSTRRPSLSANAVIFDESDEFLSIANPLTTLQSIFVVMKAIDSTYVFFGSRTDASYGLCGQINSGNPISTGFGNNTHYLDGEVMNWTNRAGLQAALNNRDSIVEVAGVTLTGWSTLTISGYSDAYPEYSYTGEVREVIALGGTPTEEARLLVVGYLAWKHGLQGNLSATHPYKAAAPVVLI